jgi:hypothetical protein
LALIGLGRGKRAAEKQREREERDQESQQKKDLAAAYDEIKYDVYPSRPDEMENFFLTEISQAEAVVTQGTPQNVFRNSFVMNLFLFIFGLGVRGQLHSLQFVVSLISFPLFLGRFLEIWDGRFFSVLCSSGRNSNPAFSTLYSWFPWTR